MYSSKLNIIAFAFLLVSYSCLSDEKENIGVEEDINFKKDTGSVVEPIIDTTINQYLINKEFGLHHPDSFLTQTNAVIIDTLHPYTTKRIATKTGIGEQYALIYFHKISDQFDCYLIFDDSFGEAGSYLLLTLNNEGFVIDYINYKDEEGFENGGISIESEFISDNQVSTVLKNSEKNVDENGNYLNHWTNKIITTKYKISDTGKFLKESERKEIIENQEERIDL